MDVMSDDEFDHVRDYDMLDSDLDSASNFSDDDDEYSGPRVGGRHAIGPVTSTPSTTPPRVRTPGSVGRKELQCPYEDCSKTFNRNARLQEHLRSHTGERPFRCPFPRCGKAFLRDSHLKHHVKSAHSDIRDYECTWEGCDKKFATGTRLRRHLQAHEGREKHRCRGYEGCNETFRKHETLKRHILAVHEKVKPFQCDRILANGQICDRAFDSASALGSHKKITHDATDFACTVCSADIADSSPPTFETFHDLQEHIQLCHLPTCNCCSQSFKTNKELSKHLEIAHAIVDESKKNAKQFPCTYVDCDQVFSKKGNLNVHVSTVHEKKKDFVCGSTALPVPEEVDPAQASGVQGCGKAFTSKASLNEHVRVTHFNLQTKRQQREDKKRAKRAAGSALSSSPEVKRRKPRKDKGIKKTSTAASLSGLPVRAQESSLVSFPRFSYSEPTLPLDDVMDEENDDWNQLSGSMTLLGEHMYHNGKPFQLKSEDGSADRNKLEDIQYMPCNDHNHTSTNDLDTEPFFEFEHEREHLRAVLDPALHFA